MHHPGGGSAHPAEPDGAGRARPLRPRRLLCRTVCAQETLKIVNRLLPVVNRSAGTPHLSWLGFKHTRGAPRVDFGPDRWRLYRLGLREAGRAARESVVWSLSRLSGAPVPTRLLFAPQDLRTADPTIATDIYSGFFAFSGRAVTTGGRPPFAFKPPSPPWGRSGERRVWKEGRYRGSP